ncbi:MAG: hypothetical protein ACR2NA_03310 [Solirubrobacterales bacterium]
MAQQRKKRKRKHRGTQGGRVDRRGRTSRPLSRAEARDRHRASKAARALQPPTWRGTLSRAALAAAVFFVAIVLIGRATIPAALMLSLVMLAVYIPMSYLVDRFFYRWRLKREAKQSG